MPNLPYTFTVSPVSPEKFAEMLATARATPHVTVAEKSNAEGTVTTPDITFEYVYDGSAAVAVSLLAANSFLARHASDATIEQHVRQLIT